MEINTGDLEAVEATRQATIEIEPTMLQSNEDVEVIKVTRQATIEIEPTTPKLSEDFETVEASQAPTEATNGNCELLNFLALCLLVVLSLSFDLSNVNLPSCLCFVVVSL